MLWKYKTHAHAAKACQITLAEVEACRDVDDDFHNAICEIEEQLVADLERSTYMRAVYGTTQPIYHKDELVGHKRVFSDTLAMRMLEAHMPEKYGKNQDQAGMDPEKFLEYLKMFKDEAQRSTADKPTE